MVVFVVSRVPFTMITTLSVLVLAASMLSVSAYNDCTGMIGTSTLSITTLVADAAANGPPFSLDFADSTVVGSPLVVTMYRASRLGQCRVLHHDMR